MSAPTPGILKILDALREVIDPQLDYNIVDPGLIYGIGVDGAVLRVYLTMTTQGCRAQDYMRAGVRQCGLQVPGIQDVDIRLVWEPPWSVYKMSPQAKVHLSIQNTAA